MRTLLVQLAEVYGKDAISYYAIGSYYFAIKDFESARKYHAKATRWGTSRSHFFLHLFSPFPSLDSSMSAAWVAFGHAFAGQGESDQALAAYRTAYRLMVG